jgi:3-oxoadipate enol-lactonase
LHAFPLHGGQWAPQVAALRDACRVIVPDARGFGGSTLGAGGHTLDDLAADVVAVLDALQVQQAVVGGLSMGGYIVFALLRRAPERVRALILADTRAGADSDEARANRYASAQLAREQGAAAVAEALLPRLLGATTQRENASLVVQVRDLIAPANPEAIARAQEAMAARHDARPLLPQLAVPTLILVGSEDVLTPPAEAEAMRAAIPGAHLVELAGAGHFSNLEQPAAFTAAVRAFLGQL